jgi:hypothetical protein
MRRISSFTLWILLGVAVALVPLACGSASSNDDGAAPKDGSKPDSTTAT